MTDLSVLYTDEVKQLLQAARAEFLRHNISHLVDMVEDSLLTVSYQKVVDATTADETQAAWKKMIMASRLSWPELFDHVEAEWMDVEYSALLPLVAISLPKDGESKEENAKRLENQSLAWELQLRQRANIQKVNSTMAAFAARVREQTRQDL